MGTGVSISSFHSPAPAMVANVSGKRLGTGMGFFMAGGELGRTLGPIVAATGVAWFGLEGIWRLMFIGWVVSGILFFRLRHVTVVPRVRQAFPWQKGLRVFSVLAWLLFSRSLFLGAITTFLPTYMNDVVNSSLWLAAAALTILEAAGVAGALLSGMLSDRWGRRGILVTMLGLSPLVLFAFLLSPAWLYVPLLLLLGFTALSIAPIFMAVVQDEFRNDRSLANGIFIALNFLALGLGVSLTGVLADAMGLQNAFWLTGFIAFLSLPAVWFLPKQTVA
ncbi:MAG: MFS transporter, partial [Trueperaceae bacterium]|nr:MFS transporter [Trueperaceae bacterium]